MADDDRDLEPVEEPLWGGLLRAALFLGALGVPAWALLAFALRVSDPLAVPRALGYPEDLFVQPTETLVDGEWVRGAEYTVTEVTLAAWAAGYALPWVLLGVAVVVFIGATWRLLVVMIERYQATLGRRAWDRQVADDAVLTDDAWTRDLPEPEPPEPS